MHYEKKTRNNKNLNYIGYETYNYFNGCFPLPLQPDGKPGTKHSQNMEQLNLTQEWDKTYPKSDKVNHSKVTFINRYGITLAADLYAPKTIFGGKLPAIAVSGPFGAVKEQSSGLYAQTLAERGFLTIALILHLLVKAVDSLAA